MESVLTEDVECIDRSRAAFWITMRRTPRRHGVGVLGRRNSLSIVECVRGLMSGSSRKRSTG
jgi:hypothetical protein